MREEGRQCRTLGQEATLDGTLRYHLLGRHPAPLLAATLALLEVPRPPQDSLLLALVRRSLVRAARVLLELQRLPAAITAARVRPQCLHLQSSSVRGCALARLEVGLIAGKGAQDLIKIITTTGLEMEADFLGALKM
jgi:hypothetical protein